jgi:anti-anti-sigma regulatory factor
LLPDGRGYAAVVATFTQPLASPQTSVQLLGGSTCIISAGPWFSSVTSAAFGDAARDAHVAGACEILLDLTAVRAVDATGTAALATLAEELGDTGCELAVASTHPGLVTWLGTSPLPVHLPVHESIADALSDLLRRPL